MSPPLRPLLQYYRHRAARTATVRLLRGHRRQWSLRSPASSGWTNPSVGGTGAGGGRNDAVTAAAAASGLPWPSGPLSSLGRPPPLLRLGLPPPPPHSAVHFPHRTVFHFFSSSSSPPPPDEGEGDGDGKGERQGLGGGTTETETGTTEANPSSSSDDDKNNDNSEHHRYDEGDDGEVAYFPWRHSSDPLPRLLDRSTSGILGGSDTLATLRFPPLYIRFLHAYSASLVDRDLSYWRIVFNRRKWEDELAVNFASAYQMALGCLLSDTFRVPPDEVHADDGSIDFDHVVVVDGDDSPQSRSKTDDDDDEEEVRRSLKSMVEGNLLDLYRKCPAAAASGDDRRIRIRLRSQIASTRLLNLHPVPVLTREAVEFNPSLRGGLRSIFFSAAMARASGKGIPAIFRMVMDELDELAVRSGNETSLDWTVVAQVELRCKETFYVIAEEGEGREDGGGATGKVLQGRRTRHRDGDGGDGEGEGEGDEGEEEEALVATHLVRFELVVTDDYGEAGGGRKMGSWRITDWDDLLGGNIWF